MSVIGRDNVVVVAGETGSGKSTQIPQFILEVKQSAFCFVIVTVKQND